VRYEKVGKITLGTSRLPPYRGDYGLASEHSQTWNTSPCQM